MPIKKDPLIKRLFEDIIVSIVEGIESFGEFINGPKSFPGYGGYGLYRAMMKQQADYVKVEDFVKAFVKSGTYLISEGRIRGVYKGEIIYTNKHYAVQRLGEGRADYYHPTKTGDFIFHQQDYLPNNVRAGQFLCFSYDYPAIVESTEWTVTERQKDRKLKRMKRPRPIF